MYFTYWVGRCILRAMKRKGADAMKTAIIGYPRIGENRELKFASEQFCRGEINEAELTKAAKEIRRKNLCIQKEAGIDFISSNDFSFYDNVLDAAVLFNIVPERYKKLGLGELETYFDDQ